MWGLTSITFRGRPGSGPMVHGFLFVLGTLVMAYYYVYLIPFHMEYYYRADFMKLMHGTANTPFQYRVLILWALRAGAHIYEFLTGTISNLGFLRDAMIIIETVFMFGLAIVLRLYLCRFIRNRVLCSLTALSMFLILPYNFLLPPMYTPPFEISAKIYRPIFYIYDIPAMFFFTLGLLLIHRRSYIAYYIMFGIATFNRETTCFLTLIYLFTAWGEERPRNIAAHVAAQAVLWAGIKYFLFTLYGDNPGEPIFEIKLMSNLSFLACFKCVPTLISCLGGLWIPTLLLYRYIGDRFVKRTVMVMGLFFSAMFVVGNLYELRIFGELLPIVLSAFALEVRGMAKLYAGQSVVTGPENVRTGYEI